MSKEMKRFGRVSSDILEFINFVLLIFFIFTGSIYVQVLGWIEMNRIYFPILFLFNK